MAVRLKQFLSTFKLEKRTKLITIFLLRLGMGKKTEEGKLRVILSKLERKAELTLDEKEFLVELFLTTMDEIGSKNEKNTFYYLIFKDMFRKRTGRLKKEAKEAKK